MNAAKLNNIIKTGEKFETEFKSAAFSLPKNLFETVCAFLNRKGGKIFLGVANNGKIEGVFEDSIKQLQIDFANGCNDSNQLSPTYYLTSEVIELDKKKIIYINIPESSQVHKTKNKIFDRNEDGDFEITNNSNLVSELYLRKQTTFSENKIFPFLSMSDFEIDLFSKIRTMAANQKANHVWLSLDDEDMLKSAGLWKKDFQTGHEGFTLAAVVLLGKESTIQSILPHYKTDAILRIQNKDRYDDRLDLRCNLFNAYYELLNFVQKHLPDKFHLEGVNRISLRDSIFREIIANLLVHREFLNHFPAKLIIEENIVFTENSNRPHGNGKIDLSNLAPFPKNPTIAKFFKEIGLVEELGSGIRKSYKYSKLYSDKNPEFIEDDIFKSIIPIPPIPPAAAQDSLLDKLITVLDEGINEGVIEGVNEGVKLQLAKVILVIWESPSLNVPSISKIISKSHQTVERYMKILRDLSIIEFQGPPKTGGYLLTERFKIKIKKELKKS